MTESSQSPQGGPLPPADAAITPRPGTTPAPSDPTAPRPRRNRRVLRWVLAIVAVIVILLIICVLLIPTIVSSGWGRSFAVSKINSNINGKAQVAGLSITWGGNINLDGFKLDDADGRQILQLAHFHAKVAPWAALHGKYYLDDVTIDGLDVYAQRDSNGVLNFSKLPRESTSSSNHSSTPSTEKPSSKAEPTRLPDIRATILLTNCRGTFEDQQKKQTVHLTSLNASVKIPDINQPIEETLDATAEIDNKPAGKVSVSGTTLLVKNNVLMTDPSQVLKEGQVDQKITLDGVELASIAPLLGPDAGIDQLTGGTQGQVTIHLKPGSDADLDALVRVANMKAAGPALKGDSFAAQQLDLAAQHVTISLPAGATDIKQAHVTTGATNGSTPITISLVLDPKSTSKISFFADASVDALERGAISRPGEPENVRWNADVDLAGIGAQIPHLLSLNDQNRFTSGRFIASGNGSSDGRALSFNSAASIQHLNSGQAFKDFTIGFVTALTSVSDSTGTHVNVSKFDIADNQSIVHIQKAADITASETTDGHMTADGKIQIAADLRAINQILKSMSATSPEVVAKTEQGAALTSGQLTGNLSIASGADRQIHLVSDLLASNLTVTQGNQTPINGEKFSIDLDASAPDDLSSAQVSKLDATGALLTAHASDVQLQLKSRSGSDTKPVRAMEILRKATLTLELPLVKLLALQEAFSPPKPPEVAAKPADEKSAAAPPAAPKPKAKLAAGTATFTLNASRNNGVLILAQQFAANDLAMDAGQGPQALGPVDFKSTISVVPAAPAAEASSSGSTPPPELMSQIRQIDVSDLLARAGGSEVSLKQPVTVKNLAGLSSLFPSTQPVQHQANGSASLDVAIVAKGELAALSRFLEAMDGAPAGTEYPYAGPYTFDQSVTASNGNIALNGHGNITNFQLLKDGKPSVTEPNVLIANDLTLASASDLTLRNLAVQMPTSKTLDLVLKGTIHDLARQRQMSLNADLGYDLAKLRELVYPLMSKANQEQIKDISVTGQFNKKFTVEGSYPAGPPFNEAIKTLKLQGGLEVATLAGKGLDIKNLDVPVFLRDGIMLIANSDKPGDYPGPSPMNSGQFSIRGSKVDLTDPHPRLTMVPGTVMLRNIALTPALADTLGSSLGNFLFVKNDQTSGLLTVTVNKCDRLPLDDTMQKNVPGNDGYLNLNASIQQLTISGGGLGNVLGKLNVALPAFTGGKAVSLGSLKGSVKNYNIIIQHGVVSHDMTVTLGEHDRPLRLAGNMQLESKAMNMTLELPNALFGGTGGAMQAILPNGIQLPVGGTISAPQFDAGAAVQKSLVGNNPQDLIQRLPGLLNNKKKSSENSNTPPATQPDDTNPLNQLQDLFNRKKK